MIQYEVRIVPDRTEDLPSRWMAYMPECPYTKGWGESPIIALIALNKRFKQWVEIGVSKEDLPRPTGMDEDKYQAWKESLLGMTS